MGGMRIARAGALALVAAVLLSACAPAPEPRITRLPSDGAGHATSAPSATSAPPAPPAPSPSEGDPTVAEDCDGRSLLLTSGSPSLAFSGECAEVRVEGSDLVVTGAGASVAVLELAGDRIVLSVGGAGALVITGNDTAITAGDVSQLTIRGDRNEVTADSITGLSLQGNDNTVRGAGSLVDDQGARNRVE